MIEYSIVPMGKISFLNTVPLLVRLNKHQQASIIHTHGYRANFYGRITSFLCRNKHVATIHVSLFDYRDTSKIIRRIYLIIEKLMSPQTSKFICISDAMHKDILKVGIPNSNTTIISNGVDSSLFHPRPRNIMLENYLGVSTDGPVIGTVGRMVPEKGHSYLIEALRILKQTIDNFLCLFIGDGPLRASLEIKAEKMGITNNCLFLGNQKKIELIYPLLNLFVLPSIREPFGLSLMEAMASKVPVVATDAGGPAEYIQSGVNGLLARPRDPVHLSSQLLRILLDKNYANQVAVKGLETAVRKYDIRTMVAKIENVYKSVLQH